MSAAKIAAVAIGLWVVTVVVSGVLYLSRGGGPEPTTADTRQAVALPTEGRDAVLAEMRTMLGSLYGVVGGVAQGDSARIRTEAAKSGMAMAADPALERMLPPGWLELAERTHRGFDELAAGAAAPEDTVLARLGSVTGNCVSCHATYRLAVR